MNLADLVIPPWVKIVAVLAAVGGVGYGLYLGYNHIENSGYNRCVTDYKIQAAAAKDAIQDKVVKEDKKNYAKIKTIQELPDNDYGVGPITSSVLDSLQR